MPPSLNDHGRCVLVSPRLGGVADAIDEPSPTRSKVYPQRGGENCARRRASNDRKRKTGNEKRLLWFSPAYIFNGWLKGFFKIEEGGGFYQISSKLHSTYRPCCCATPDGQMMYPPTTAPELVVAERGWIAEAIRALLNGAQSDSSPRKKERYVGYVPLSAI